jgi:hypothetical protein
MAVDSALRGRGHRGIQGQGGLLFDDKEGHLCDVGLVHFPDQVSGRVMVEGLGFGDRCLAQVSNVT